MAGSGLQFDAPGSGLYPLSAHAFLAECAAPGEAGAEGVAGHPGRRVAEQDAVAVEGPSWYMIVCPSEEVRTGPQWAWTVLQVDTPSEPGCRRVGFG